MDVERYLARIGYEGARVPAVATLRGLHLAHLYRVPFENLDIGLGRPIVLDEAAVFEKIVCRRRGGFCYELNGLFAALLRALGFRVALLAARAVGPGGALGPEFDHLTLRVDLEEPWLADVGWGDSFLEPLRLDSAEEQPDHGRVYRVVADGATRRLQQCTGDGQWQDHYQFTLRPYAWSDFAEMCRHHQTAPQSTFTQRRICTLATPAGRVTIADRRLIITAGGVRRETPLADEAAAGAALREHFGVVL
jgi:N-hydroxyarylamine O-acetyltransferase